MFMYVTMLARRVCPRACRSCTVTSLVFLAGIARAKSRYSQWCDEHLFRTGQITYPFIQASVGVRFNGYSTNIGKINF